VLDRERRAFLREVVLLAVWNPIGEGRLDPREQKK
jgi:hypothetical protein